MAAEGKAGGGTPHLNGKTSLSPARPAIAPYLVQTSADDAVFQALL